MSEKLDGRVAIVTGGAGGIGSATAKRLAADGARVVVADINGEIAVEVTKEIVASGGEAMSIEIDLSDLEQVRGLIEKTIDAYGQIDVLHNNAAVLGNTVPDLMVADLDFDVWELLLRVNLTSVAAACKYALPHMVRQGRGSIINMSSLAALMGMDVMPGYGATKAAVNALTRTIGTQYGRSGIRCNAIAPGAIMRGTPAQGSPFITHQMTPIAGQPEDIAAMVSFLASDDAKFINGQVMVVDGGTTAMMSVVPAMRGSS